MNKAHETNKKERHKRIN